MDRTKLTASPAPWTSGRFSGFDVVARRLWEGRDECLCVCLCPCRSNAIWHWFHYYDIEAFKGEGLNEENCIKFGSHSQFGTFVATSGEGFENINGFPTLLSWQLSFNCCAFWMLAKLAYQIMLLNTTLFSQKQHMFNFNRRLSTLNSLNIFTANYHFHGKGLKRELPITYISWGFDEGRAWPKSSQVLRGKFCRSGLAWGDYWCCVSIQ